MEVEDVRDVHEAHRQRWQERFGYRPSQARPCPRTLAGKTCRLLRRDCECQSFTRVLDHSRRWTGKDGQPVITAEPYGLDGDQIADFVTAMHRLRLEVYITGWSAWFPSETLALIVTLAGEGTSSNV